MADAGSENCHCQCSFSNAVLYQKVLIRHRVVKQTNFKVHTTIVRPGSQGNIDNAISKINQCSGVHMYSGWAARLPLHSRGFQRPREMLQVVCVTLTTPRLERRAWRMVILHFAFKPDVRLLRVAFQRRYVHCTQTGLVSFLCWQTSQVRVQPRFTV